MKLNSGLLEPLAWNSGDLWHKEGPKIGHQAFFIGLYVT